MLINLKTHIQMQSKIMKKRQRKKNNKNVFIPLIPVEMTEEEVKQILKLKGRKIDMKKTAVLLYDSFCNFEISPALEILALAEKPITIFGISKQAIRSEDGLSVIPDATIDNFDLDAYDSLILPGAMDIREAIENKKIIDFIKKFDRKTIGAISIAPLLLVRAGLLNGKPFMAGVNKEEIFEEGFSKSDLAEMVGWEDNINKPIKDGYIITGNIITSISYNFVKWALAFGKMVGIDIPAKTFGIQ